jgi:predicted ATPase with chaperone activity
LDRIDIQKYMGPVDFIRYEAELTAGTENGDPEQAGAEPASATVPRLRYRDELQRSAENLDLQVPQTFYSSKDLQKQVAAARKLQAERFSHIDAISTNGEMQNKHIKEFCPLDTESRKIILKAFETYGFSARTYHRIIKLSRTFADVEQEQHIRLPHVISALVARDLDTERKSRFYHGR